MLKRFLAAIAAGPIIAIGLLIAAWVWLGWVVIPVLCAYHFTSIGQAIAAGLAIWWAGVAVLYAAGIFD